MKNGYQIIQKTKLCLLRKIGYPSKHNQNNLLFVLSPQHLVEEVEQLEAMGLVSLMPIISNYASFLVEISGMYLHWKTFYCFPCKRIFHICQKSEWLMRKYNLYFMPAAAGKTVIHEILYNLYSPLTYQNQLSYITLETSQTMVCHFSLLSSIDQIVWKF